jgi:hypothetical protein
MMRSLLRLSLLALLSAPAQATTWTGADYAGADLLPANGDTLSGTFANVGLFQIGSGSTVTVASLPSGPNLVVYAATISISGTLDASGRGQGGGSGGASPNNGSIGFGGLLPGTANVAAGSGAGGISGKGGGGAGGGGWGGPGAGDSGGGVGASSGAFYGSTGTITSPLSADDLFQGSGGGGGGGSNGATGGSGGSGGGAVYLEASSMTLTGSILVSGLDANSASDANAGPHPGGGGGGSGGTLLLRVPGVLNLVAGSRLSANGGRGGHVLVPAVGGQIEPGGGGGGGRLKIFSRPGNSFSVTLSTSGGTAGSSGGFSGTVDAAIAPTAGLEGTASFGTIASSPSAFAAQSVYVTSISWVWNAAPDFGNAPGSQSYRIFAATTTAPFPAPEATSLLTATTVAGLTPNTTYFRFVTAFTDWGDGLPSNAASTHTLANAPAGPAFSSVSEASLTFSWTAGAPLNPDYTTYSVERSTAASFAGSSAQSLVALSSSPAGLTPNTTYYWRARAVNLDGVPSTYTTALATVTLAAAPSTPAFGGVYITSVSLAWSQGDNPPATLYTAQVSSDNFFSLIASSITLGSSATFFNLAPGTQYFFRAFALNHAAAPSAFTAVLSTRSGALSDTSAPAAPSKPEADRRFSYDGTALYSWPAAQSPVGILDYHLIIGSTPGGSDFFSGSTTTLSFSAAGLPAGRTYYARVRARSNAGVYSLFSDISEGLPVFITAQASAISKPFNWPNPFDPAQGPTQIGFFLEEPADVETRIYTLQGELVFEESRRYDSAGNQVASWNGANNSGLRAAPGGYVVMLRKRYNGRVDVQKFKIAVIY